MLKKQRYEAFIQHFSENMPVAETELHYENPFQLLVAEVLSAQCTDERVNKITPLLFAKASNPTDMITLSMEEIQAIIRPCGLSPKKAYAIWTLSHMILNEHNGQVPNSFEALEAMPGVGHKTASVVMSQAFGHPAFPVDTHIHRLLTRWGLTSGKNVVQTEKDAKALFPRESWNKLHLQIIFYGRSHSPARSPKKEIDYITCHIGTKKALLELK